MDSGKTVRLEFLLNGKRQILDIASDLSALQMLKHHFHLMGTKEGCGEGDCGACTVAIGSPVDGTVEFKAVASCILPAVKLQGKHLITIEGLGDHTHLHRIQEHIINAHGIQCGFCSPGIILSFFALFASRSRPTMEEIDIALQGNICRCTGYEGIRKAGKSLTESLKGLDEVELARSIVPSYVAETLDILTSIEDRSGTASYRIPHTLKEFTAMTKETANGVLLSGGTDVQVQIRQKKIPKGTPLIDISRIEELKYITVKDNVLCIGSQNSITGCSEHPLVREHLPELVRLAPLMASTQIRNLATIAGNMANASPIADTTVLLLALGASLTILRHQTGIQEQVPLDSFFLGYRETALGPSDLIVEIRVPLAGEKSEVRFSHFEKTSRRKDVDIATLNSASLRIQRETGEVSWSFAFGGAGPVPFLVTASTGLTESDSEALLIGKLRSEALRKCSLIDDVRGSSAYRRLLVGNHISKHVLIYAEEV